MCLNFEQQGIHFIELGSPRGPGQRKIVAFYLAHHLLGQGVTTGHRIDLYWSPRRNIRGIEYCHVIGLFGISAVPSGDHLGQLFSLIAVTSGHRA